MLFLFVSYTICMFVIHYVDTSEVMFGNQLVRQSFRKLQQLSVKHCKDECILRKTCKSYNYIRSKLLCELNRTDKVDVPNDYMKQIKSIYGQITDREASELRPGCSSCQDNEVCKRLGDGTFGCFIQECQSPPPIYSGAETFGNLNNMGAKVRYTCSGVAIRHGNLVSQCKKTGIWDLPDFQCDRCLTPNIDVTTDVTSTFIHIRCIGNFITRGSPLRCGEDGMYVYRNACCDTPDQDQWLKIYKINTAGGLGPRSLMYGPGHISTGKDCQFRRFDIIKHWSELNITRVKIQINVQTDIKAWITFDGRGVNNYKWFSQSSLIQTSWQDLSIITDEVMFNINDAQTNGISRVVYTILEAFSPYNCSQISGWVMI